MYKIYMITNVVNGKLYIGLTKHSLAERFNQHSTKKIKHVSAIQDAINKYGKVNFTIQEIASSETLDEAYFLERLAIRYYNTLSPLGYNLHTGGTGGKLSDDIKKKISKANKEYYSLNPNPTQGKKHSEETILKIKLAKSNISQETRMKMSESKKGQPSYWKGTKASEMPFGDRGGWNKGIPMNEEAKVKRRKTKFVNGVNEVFEKAFDLEVINKNEIEYMRNYLTNSYFDVIVGFLITKVSNVKWGCSDRTREEKDRLVKLNAKIKSLYKLHKKL